MTNRILSPFPRHRKDALNAPAGHRICWPTRRKGAKTGHEDGSQEPPEILPGTIGPSGSALRNRRYFRVICLVCPFVSCPLSLPLSHYALDISDIRFPSLWGPLPPPLGIILRSTPSPVHVCIPPPDVSSRLREGLSLLGKGETWRQLRWLAPLPRVLSH